VPRHDAGREKLRGPGVWTPGNSGGVLKGKSWEASKEKKASLKRRRSQKRVRLERGLGGGSTLSS